MAVALSGAAAPVTGVRLAPELGGSVGRLRARAARGVASEPRVPVPRTAPAVPGPGPVFLPREQVWGYVSGLARRFRAFAGNVDFVAGGAQQHVRRPKRPMSVTE